MSAVSPRAHYTWASDWLRPRPTTHHLLLIVAVVSLIVHFVKSGAMGSDVKSGAMKSGLDGRMGPKLAAVTPVPARQPLLPEPVVAERLVAAPAALALAEVAGALQRPGHLAVARAEQRLRAERRRSLGRPTVRAHRRGHQQREHGDSRDGRHCDTFLLFLYSP